ncbi:hypothetical protein [Devriesea agamarum]|uniref:hypothetical protein n=1 Tax=Devriesea agamarum TaxID=472569 RepID=UPI0012ED468F|nr:hypothetical protein [Devriesea agamarum]
MSQVPRSRLKAPDMVPAAFDGLNVSNLLSSLIRAAQSGVWALTAAKAACLKIAQLWVCKIIELAACLPSGEHDSTGSRDRVVEKCLARLTFKLLEILSRTTSTIVSPTIIVTVDHPFAFGEDRQGLTQSGLRVSEQFCVETLVLAVWNFDHGPFIIREAWSPTFISCSYNSVTCKAAAEEYNSKGILQAEVLDGGDYVWRWQCECEGIERSVEAQSVNCSVITSIYGEFAAIKFGNCMLNEVVQ